MLTSLLATTVLSPWALGAIVQQLFAYPFMQNAFLAGTLIALVAGAVGYFMVLRGQSFAGHTLANVGFPGAVGAVLVGAPQVVGLLLFCLGAALGMEALTGQSTRSQRGQDVAISTVQTVCLGLGLLFMQISSTYTAGIYALLFGAVLGISDRDVVIIAFTTLITLGGLITIARPLLFASLDPEVAEARGVPVRLLSRLFLVLLAFTVAQSVQIVGILLIFSLLVTPAAIAQQITPRPAVAIALAIALALLFTWTGLAIAYFTPYPVGFFITTAAFATYVLVRLLAVGWSSLMAKRRQWGGMA